MRRTHPLYGADPLTLAQVLARSGPIPRRSIPTLAGILAASLVRLPFALGERAAVAAASRRARLTQAPVFIVGHWRSGTTHLVNVMSRDPAMGIVPPLATGLPWEFLGLGRVLRPLLDRALPPRRFIDRVPVNPDSPQEDEIALANMQPLSFYHGLYFPRRFHEQFERGVFLTGCSEREIHRWAERARHLYGKLQWLQPGRRLLIKNPVYSTRVERLARLYPGARFIHIHRNPYRVFESMRNFYRVLFERFALQPWQHVAIDEFILDSYPRIMQALLEQTSALPPDRCVHVRFERLQRRPLEELERIYATLGLGGFEAARPYFERYLESVRDYRKNAYEFPADRVARVRRRWGALIDRLGYPASIR